MITLGINSVYHESAAAIVVDGELVAAAEEERFNRHKHGKVARVDNPHLLPASAIQYCIDAAGITAGMIDAVGYSFDPAVRKERFVVDPRSKKGDWGDMDGEETFRSCLGRIINQTCALLGTDVTDRFHWIPHHIAHASSAFYASGFSESAILVVDGIGEVATTFFAAGRDRSIQPMAEYVYPDSLGFVWEKVCRFLGFSEYDACKVMGLAAYGNGEALSDSFERLVKVNGSGFSVDPAVMEYRLDSFDQLEKYLGARPSELERRRADVAAALQSCTDRVMLSLVNQLYHEYPSSRLCLAGGVALNCSSNWRIKEQGPFEELYIPSAAHDAGTAVGSALYLNSPVRVAGVRGLQSPYLGPEFDNAAIERAMCDEGLTPARIDDPACHAARLLEQGRIVGWFQGRMEFGPRALGNRSLLADPRRSDSRTRMNDSVKRREAFRPFAPSVLTERCREWFDIGKPSIGYQYMLFACPVKTEKAKYIPAVVHADGTSRIQIVQQSWNPLFYALISNFEKLTGIPMVLNTSFNDSEPIVCTPRDALRTFAKNNIDALFIGQYCVERIGRAIA